MARLENIRKIAVLRANGLGDFLFVLPALHALKAAYPEAELVYLGCPWHKAFLDNRPGPVDRVIAIPVSHGVRTQTGRAEDPEELAEFFSRIREEKFDLALQLHGGGRNSNPFLLKLGAHITAGLATPDAPPLDITIPYIFYQNEVMRYLEVANAVGAIITQLEPIVRVTIEDLAAIARVSLSPDSPLLVLHPGASDPRRRWATAKFAAVGDHFAALGATVVITGAGDEKSLVEAVTATMNHRSVNLYGRLSWPALVGLLASADIVIANDTGPLHLAAAVGAPTVGIFWCGNMINGAPFMRQRHRPAISWMIHCPDCGTNVADAGFPFQSTQIIRLASGGVEPGITTCDHPYSFVDPIQPEEVIANASNILRTVSRSDETLSRH